MVFEQIFRLQWIQHKHHAFYLGFFYAILGLVSARFIFPSSVGMMAIAFTSLLLIPSLVELLHVEENVVGSESSFELKKLFYEHKDVFKIYLFVFLGVFLAFSLAALFLPQEAVQKFFPIQFKAAGVGFATSDVVMYKIIVNNIQVFVICFLLSLVYGAGSMLFLAWNASVWGVVFGFFVRNAAFAVGANPVAHFFESVIPFLPHMTTEALAYISAAIVGGVVSKAVLREKLFSARFHHILVDALIFLVIGIVLVVIGAIIEVKFFGGLR